MIRKQFNVVIPKGDGGYELYRMKEWLRANPGYIPSGLDPSNNSHSLRNGLIKMGWSVQLTDSEERLIMPGTDVDSVLGLEDNEEGEEAVASFRLESQLQDFLASNLEQIPINGMKLKLYKDPDGKSGKEYETNKVGRIDILAVDENGDFVVCELKRAETPDKAIGQLSRYMGWVKKTVGNGKNVRGVIIAGIIDDYLKYSIEAIPDISLFEYELSFNIREVKGFDEK